MRQLKCYSCDVDDFIKSIISSTKERKRDEEESGCKYKQRCINLFSAHKIYIKRYKIEFDNNTLENLDGTHPKLSLQEKNDMLSLYQYSRKPIQALRHEVLIDNGYENGFCPLCGVNLAETMDHFIPQTGYPLFAVHPLNLIPSCERCNKHKSDIISDGKKRKFWNPYIDTPPKEEYLECEVKEGIGGIVEVDFRLKKGSIDENTYRLLENTMLKKGQDVFGVYKEASGKIISSFIMKAVRQIQKVNQKKSFNECLADLKNEVEDEYETNDCVSVIRKALVTSSVFIKNLKEELDRQCVKYIE